MKTPARVILALAATTTLSTPAPAQDADKPGAQPAAPPAAAPAAAEPVPLNIPEGPKWSSEQIAKVGDMLKGSWKTTSAVAGRQGASSAEIVMTIVPIRTVDIADAMYVETRRADSPASPFRETLFQLYTYKGKVRLRTYEPTSAAGRDALGQLAGFWAAPKYLPLLSSTTVKRADFIATLDVELEPAGGGFSGKTPYPYPTGAEGAVEMTSELTLTQDRLVSADRGLDASGKVVWGSAENDKYTFARFNPGSPTVEERENGLILLWYKKVVEGETLNESLRYYAHYTGWQAGGPMLDTSRTRDKPGGPFGLIPIPKVAIGTIRGWREALQGTGFGTRVKMLVPGHLAYGKNPVQREGKAVVPVDAPMVFDVEIMGVEPAQAPAPVPAPPGTKLVPKGAGDGGERPAK